MAKIYLVDSENVGASWSQLLPSLSGEDKMYVFYTDKSPYISYENLLQVIAYCNIPVFIKCHEGKNALDFQLVSELGFKLCQSPEAEFFIVSDDYGYDAAVKYWSGRKYNVHRMSKKFCRPMPAKKREEAAEVHVEASSQQETVTDQVQEVIAQEVMAQDAAAAYVEMISQQAPVTDPEEDFRQEAEQAPEQSHPQQEHLQQDNQTRKQARDRRRRHRKEAAKEPSVQNQTESGSAEQEAVESAVVVMEPEAAGPQIVTDREAVGQKTQQVEEQKPAEPQEVQPEAIVTAAESKAEEKQLNEKQPDEKQPEAELKAAERSQEALVQPVQKERRRRNAGRRQKAEKPGKEAAEGEKQLTAEGAANEKVQAMPSEAVTAKKEQAAAEAQPQDQAVSKPQVLEKQEDADVEARAEQTVKEPDKEEAAAALETEASLQQQILTMVQKWESPQPEKDAKCVVEMFRTLSMSNLTVVNTALTVLTGIELGNNIYRELKEHQECRVQLDSLYMDSQKDRFMHYVQIVLDRSDLEGITAEEIGKFLLRIPRKNLNSIRSNMLKEFGHDKGAEIYSVYKPHIKVLNKI